MFLSRNVGRKLVWIAALGLVCAGANAGEKKPPAPKRYEVMDYGPFIFSTMSVGQKSPNVTAKCLSIRLKGDRTINIGFDTELLRVMAGWSNGFSDWSGPTFSGSHSDGMFIRGDIQFSTKTQPGWGKDGGFTDPRNPKDGPLPADWAKYKGLYVNGERVILSYTVGDCKVLETFGAIERDGAVVFTRNLTLGPSSKALDLNLADVENGAGSVDGDIANCGSVRVGISGAPKGSKLIASDNSIRYNIPPLNAPVSFKITIGKTDDAAKFAAMVDKNVESLETLTKGGPARWNPPITEHGVTAEKDAIEKAKRKAEQTLADAKKKAQDGIAAAKKRIESAANPAEKTVAEEALQGVIKTTETAVANAVKASAWTPEKEAAALAELGGYVVDTIVAPEKNEWNSWMRFGGFDFFSDGTTAAISTWSGDIWVVKGIDASLENLTWKRFASGLFQPLGLKIVDDKVYTLGRDGITRFHDLNGDGEADFYENFNNDVTCTQGFHEFSFDLQTDPEGNFYFAKGAPVNPGGRGFQRIAANNGCLMKVSKDGSKSEVFATGFRAPNGIGVGPNGEVTSGDNQGTWQPLCPINLIKKDGFYGVYDAHHRDAPPAKRDYPICWMPMNRDNSGGGQTWVTSDRWGPLKGHMLHCSYGQSSLYAVMYEEIDGILQGGATRFPLTFQTGIMRPRFNAKDGQLYVCGLTGWQSNGAKDHGFQRVRYTGKPVHMAREMHVVKGGIEITFTNSLDPATASDINNWSGESFNMVYSSKYGTDEYAPSDFEAKNINPVDYIPRKEQDELLKTLKKGHEAVTFDGAQLKPDGKTVFLKYDKVKPVTNLIIKFRMKAADGAPVQGEIDSTIHKVPTSTKQ